MDKRQKQAIDAYRRVQRFLVSNPVLSPASYAKPKEMLDGVIARLTELSVAQVDGKRESVAETQRLASLVRKLRDRHLKPLVALARAHIADKEGIEKVLKLPNGALAPLYQLAEARQMRDAARRYATEFVKFGRPEDFIEQLSAAIDAVENALGGRAAQAGTHIGARAAIEAELRLGRQVVEVLDTIVNVAFEDDVKSLAAWRAAKRIQALPGGAASADEPAAA